MLLKQLKLSRKSLLLMLALLTQRRGGITTRLGRSQEILNPDRTQILEGNMSRTSILMKSLTCFLVEAFLSHMVVEGSSSHSTEEERPIRILGRDPNVMRMTHLSEYFLNSLRHCYLLFS